MSGLYFEIGTDLWVIEKSAAPTDVSQGTGAADSGPGGSPDGGATDFGLGDDVYFQAGVDGVTELLVYDEATPGTPPVEIQPATAQRGNGLDPEDFVAYDGEVFFSGRTAGTNTPYLWKSNGALAGTKPVHRAASPVVNGSLAVYVPLGKHSAGRLFFNGEGIHPRHGNINDLDRSHDLWVYSAASGKFADVSYGDALVSKTLDTVSGAPGGLDPLYATNALSAGPSASLTNDLFMAGTDKKGLEELFMYGGSGLSEIKGGDAAFGLTPWDITAVSSLGSDGAALDGVYFSGLDATGERALFFADAAGAEIVASSSTGGSSFDLDPTDIVGLDGKVYFDGNDNDGGGRGLFEYDPASGATTELIDSSWLNLNVQNRQLEDASNIKDAAYGNYSTQTIAVYDDYLYFAAVSQGNVNEIYEYAGPGTQTAQAGLRTLPNTGTSISVTNLGSF